MKTAYNRLLQVRSNRPRASRRAGIGMTLVEMLVAISVLSVMILAVSQILVQTQRFITAAKKSRRSHAMAFNIAERPERSPPPGRPAD